MELTGLLLIIFTIAIGFATFVENDFGTLAAKAGIYNAKWFEVLLLLLAVNMTGSIFKNKMYLKHKWPILLFHVSFLIIFLGAGVTRYVGYEGIMSIREGTTSNQFRSDETYIRIWAEDDAREVYKEEVVFATPSKVTGFKKRLSTGSHNVQVEILEYYTNAAETYVDEEGGDPLVWLVVSGAMGGRQNLYLTEGQVKSKAGYTFSYKGDFEGAGVRISKNEDGLIMVSSDSIQHVDMMANTSIMIPPDSTYALKPMNLYKIGNSNIVLKQYFDSAKKKMVSTEGQDGVSSMDAFRALITVGDQSETLYVYGGKGFINSSSEVEVNRVKVAVNYGSKPLSLPFSIKLDDFELERYPGSNSPSSYSSDITVIDESENLEIPYKIYMNNVLNYRGYRFFQSSYDRDEKGTILSVNHDSAGTIITYIGYFIMTLGMIVTIFNKNSRFKLLYRLSSKVRNSRKEIVTLLLAAGFLGAISQQAHAANESTKAPEIKIEHAEAFGKLQVQDHDGRIKPVNTVASEVLRKLARKTKFEGQTPEQVFLGIMAFPQDWQNVPIIKIGHPQIADFLEVDGKLAAFNQVVDMKTTGKYKLQDYVEKAYAKKPSEQSKFDKEVIKMDERVNIFYMVYSGSFLSVFPIPDDENNKWVTSADAQQFGEGEEALFVGGIFQMYFSEIAKALESNDWSVADEHLGYIVKFQERYGIEVLLSESKVNLEIAYNNYGIFGKLSRYFGLIGFILIVLHFINILNPKINLKWVIRISSIFVVLLFLMHSAGLILRWNISGHAPWSNGYESMLYIAWATVLSGLIFVRKSEITLAVTALLASLILSVAGMSWMDPEITTLVPVLKSYWLIIHVAIITASYGFLALGALLGFNNLLLMNLKTKNNVKRLNLTITELSYIIEMTLIIGLFMLTIGTFLGGVWANESWGRYWGWDPKETWALATVLFYSFVVHMRFIPGFRGTFAFSFAALISYSFVLMTYFGVNYYLSGLHSYAAGDAVPVPSFVYYTLIVIAVVSIMAYITNNKVDKTLEKATEPAD